jgi:hypothetical protein
MRTLNFRIGTLLLASALLSSCGNEVSFKKSKGDGSEAAAATQEAKDCESLSGVYTSDDNQTLTIRNCAMTLYVKPPVGQAFGFDSTIETTSKVAGWIFINVTQQKDMDFLDAQRSQECTFSLMRGTLSVTCKIGLLRQKFHLN